MANFKRLALSALLFAAPLTASADFAFGTPGFERNSAALGDRAREILKDAATWLERLPNHKLRIYGSRGVLESETSISLERLQNARQYLIGIGVKEDRILLVDLGSSRPVRPNCKSEANPDECDEFNRNIQLDLFAP